MSDIVRQLPGSSPTVYEVWYVKKVPGEMKIAGRFTDEAEAWIFRETIKYHVASSKIKTIDRRI